MAIGGECNDGALPVRGRCRVSWKRNGKEEGFALCDSALPHIFNPAWPLLSPNICTVAQPLVRELLQWFGFAGTDTPQRTGPTRDWKQT